MNKKKQLLSAICLLAGMGGNVFSAPGTSVFDFLKIGVGARALGMGEAFSAVSDDASSVYWNPGALCHAGENEISLMHLSWLEGIRYQFAGLALPLRNQAGLGFGVYYLAVDGIDTYDNTGGRLDGTAAVSDLAASLTYSREIRNLKDLSAGVSVKSVQESLAGERTGSILADLGFLYSPRHANSLQFSFVAQNTGLALRYGDSSYALPVKYTLGFSGKFFSDSLLLAADASSVPANSWYVCAGCAYRLDESITLRAGYKYVEGRTAQAADTGLRCGLGLGGDTVSFDYAFVPYGVLGNAHRIGVLCRFGEQRKLNSINANLKRRLARAKRAYRNNDLVEANREFLNVLVVDPVNDEAKAYVLKIKARAHEAVTEKKIGLIERYIREDKLVEAKEEIDAVISVSPDNPRAQGLAGQVSKRLEEQGRERINALFVQGIEFYKSANYEEAISLWEKVLLLDPGHAQAAAHIGTAKQELDKLEAGRQEKKKQEKIVQAQSYYESAVKLSAGGELDRARGLFEEALKCNPGHSESKAALIGLNSRLAAAQYAAGQKLYGEKNLEAAVSSLEKAASLDPQKQEIGALLQKARRELSGQRKAEAEEYNKNAFIEYNQGNIRKAADLWEKASRLDPADTKLQNSLERARRELEKK